MPVATTTTTQTIESLKANVGRLTLTPESPASDLRAFAHVDNSPSIGTEFRSFSKNGSPILSIREVLADDAKLKALGRLV